MSKSFKIFISISAVVLVAVLGSIFVNIGLEWFAGLNKPSQFVPSFIIPIIWTIIYILTAIILFNLIKQDNLTKSLKILFLINGFLNVFWCLVFFTLKQTQLGNLVIVINAYFGAYLIYALSKVNKNYARLLTIYPIWLIVATTLNTCLWILN